MALLVLITATSAGAQVQGVIYYSEGGEFLLTTSGQRILYTPESLDLAGGVIMQNNDMIQTRPDTFVEFQLIPGGTVLKLADNSSILVSGLSESDWYVSITLLYGRLRVISGGGTGGKDVVVRGGNAAVEIKNGDINLNYSINSADGVGRPSLHVDAFYGSADIITATADPNSSRIPVLEGESVTLEASTATLAYVVRGNLTRDIIDYWTANNFVGPAPIGLPVTTLPTLTQSQQGQVQEPYYTSGLTTPVGQPLGDSVAAQRLRKGGILAGTILIATGLGMQLAAPLLESNNPDLAKTVRIAGYGPIGFGVFALLSTLFYNPDSATP